jgi:hypothetical protein
MVTEYPFVHGEVATIKKIKQGFSISRIGDGELGCMDNVHGYSREKHNDKLSKELRRVMSNPSKGNIVGIPTMDKKGSKYRTVEKSTNKEVGWFRHKDRFCKLLSPDVEYYSAFISRPDCGEWMLNVEYARLVQSIWIGKKTAVIGSRDNKENKDNKVLTAVRMSQECEYIECPFSGAYAEIENLYKKALGSGCELILVSAGVTATCLTNRLAPHVQAVDIGSIGGFLLKMLGAEKWHV